MLFHYQKHHRASARECLRQVVRSGFAPSPTLKQYISRSLSAPGCCTRRCPPDATPFPIKPHTMTFHGCSEKPNIEKEAQTTTNRDVRRSMCKYVKSIAQIHVGKSDIKVRTDYGEGRWTRSESSTRSVRSSSSEMTPKNLRRDVWVECRAVTTGGMGAMGNEGMCQCCEGRGCKAT